MKNEAPGNTKTGVTVQDGVTRGSKASSNAIVHSDTGDSQEKSSGKASVEVSGINYHTAAELQCEYDRRTKAWNEANRRMERHSFWIARV